MQGSMTMRQTFLRSGLQRGTTKFILALGLLHAGVAGAVGYLNLIQTPAVLSSKGIAPNLMVLLDNSGSMQWEFLGTNGAISNYDYGFPPGSSQVYGANNYGNSFPSFSANNANAAQYRANYVNPNYYDPSVTYVPWACAGPYPESSTDSPSLYTAPGYYSSTATCHWDGAVNLWVMPNANPNQAMLNPTLSGVWRSVNVWNDSADNTNATANNGFSNSTSTTFVNGSSSKTKSGFWPATYFNYFGPQPGTATDYATLSNYQYVQICPPTASPTTNSNGVSSAATITVNSVAMPICAAPPALPATPLPQHTYLDSSGNYVYIPASGGSSTQSIVRSYAAEMQNFANWYQYYRSHGLLARAGIGQAFMSLRPGFRVDFGLLNSLKSGSSNWTSTTTQAFDQTAQRTSFLNNLYTSQIPQNNTPSRLAVYNVGNWLKGTPSSSAPWGPSTQESTALAALGVATENMPNALSCRQNYLVFVTDGAWNDTYNSTPVTANADSTAGSTITSSTGQTYTYAPSAPYNNYDNKTNSPYSLANVAMYFWVNDLQAGMSNNVPTNSADPGFWQHMNLFAVGLGTRGNLSPSTDWVGLQAGTTKWDTNSCWTGTSCSGQEPQQIDDLWHSAVDGHGDYVSASKAGDVQSALNNTLVSIVNRTQASSSVGLNTQQGGQYQTSTQVFYASYHPTNWWGELTANGLYRDNAGYLQVASVANWDASCVLTGGSCPAMNPTAPPTVTVQSPSSRSILTWTPGVSTGGGIAFEYTSLPAAVQTQINSSVVSYLRGDRSNETSQSNGTLRTRTSVLGDLVDSSPRWVGPPSQNYPSVWIDKLNPAGTQLETAYSSWQGAMAQRQHVVYIGGNDGLVHGFRTGSYDASGNFVSSTNDGREVLAYMPSTIFGTISNYASPNYSHQFYVDATPASGDLFYGGKWHTWLAGGLGAGGQSIYVLDVTDPSTFSESNASSLVRQEINPGNIDALCGGSSGSGACSNDLGYTFGAPLIRRMHNGKWAVIFGNGYNSANGHGVVFVGVVDPTTGALNVKKFDTGAGPAQDPTGASRANGIAYVAAADLDGDHIVDYLYATDLFGNVWRIDVTGSSSSNWAVSTYGNGAPTPLYSAKDSSGVAQSITTTPLVMSLPQTTGPNRLLVSFGTGKMLEAADQLPKTQVQAMYGIWDRDMTAWNAKNSIQYATLTAPQSTLGLSNLQAQTIGGPYDSSGGAYTSTSTGTAYRTLTSNPVCWQGATGISGCTSYTKYGWYVNLTDSNHTPGEMVIYNPIFQLGVIQVNTTIPSNVTGLTCTNQAISGWTMAINPATGGAFSQSFYANDQHQFVLLNNLPVMGVALGASGSPSIVSDNGKYYDIQQSQSPNGNTPPGGPPPWLINPPGTGGGGRLTWIQLR